MRAMLALVDRVTAADVPVLVVGESGTGKELVARAIHDNGPRGARPSSARTARAIPETLLESTLFGHVRGAFTGADRPRAGLFDVADGGTLFLDEIGEMSLGDAGQAPARAPGRRGPPASAASARARSTCASSPPRTATSAEMVEAGRFREDLFYRLNVITVRVPPLRERPDDIPLLVRHFVEKHARDRHAGASRARRWTGSARSAWPGNVRQLENEVRRALVLADGVIDVEQLSAEVAGRRPGARATRRASTCARASTRSSASSCPRRSSRRAATRRRPRSCSGCRASACRR